MPTRVFISYDYDNDPVLKEFLVGQAKLPGAPFVISDWSIKVASPGWKNEARRRIRASDVVAVLCGLQTHNAVGVATEVKISQEEKMPYFLLKGYKNKTCTRPSTSRATDTLYKWGWENLKLLIGGSR